MQTFQSQQSLLNSRYCYFIFMNFLLLRYQRNFIRKYIQHSLSTSISAQSIQQILCNITAQE